MRTSTCGGRARGDRVSRIVCVRRWSWNFAIPIVAIVGLTPWVLVFYEIVDVSVTLWSHSIAASECPPAPGLGYPADERARSTQS